MGTRKPFWLGLAGSLVGMVLFTGMSFFWQDVFTVDRSGTIDFRVSNTGNIGIGMQGASDSPGSRLVVKASGTGTTTSAFDVQASDGTSRLFVRDDGRVGIGTTTPEAPLDVNGQMRLRLNSADLNGVQISGFGNPFNYMDITSGRGADGTYRDMRIATGTWPNWNGGQLYLKGDGNVGMGTISPDSILELAGADAAMSLNENSATPASPASGAEARIYMKADKLVIQYNDGGTVKYRYLTLNDTTATWTYTTTAP